MVSRFETCLKFVLAREGGYVDRSEDRGGPTNKGITQVVYSAYIQRRHLPIQSVRFISDDEVADIYRSDYWKPCAGDNLPIPIDLVVFDGAVNHGVRQSIKFLQRALGTDDDGIIGPVTINAAHMDVNNGYKSHLVADVIDQRQDFYQRIVERDPSQRCFLNGWSNRLKELGREVA